MSKEQQNWLKRLPKAYSWMDQLKVEAASGVVEGAWNLVPVSTGSGQDQILAKLGADLEKKLREAMSSYGWTTQEKTLKLVLDEGAFLLVVKSSLKTTPAQLARQLGLDTAAALAKNEKRALAIHVDSDTDALDVLEGYCLGLDDAAYYKSKVSPDLPASVYLPEASLAGASKRCAMIQSVMFTRWLQDSPANVIHSENLAAMAEEFFADKSKLTILGRKQMREKGMGSLLSVAEGAVRDPKLISILFEGEDSSKTVALTGKGVTFDTGGISLKPSLGMDEMKYDMSGAAGVFGAAHYFSKFKPPVNVVCVIGAVENVPSATATLPGDIVTSLSGKTIEVLNTDAEGRLVLADVLTNTIREYKPNLMLDFATLTGAVIFGLGHAGAAMFSPDESTADYLKQVAKTTGEPMWQLPMWPELEAEVGSELADLKNIAKPNVKAGTIMGAMFLNEFAKESTGTWAHIDIAGTAWSCSATGYVKNGGSAYGVRFMVGVCERFEG